MTKTRLNFMAATTVWLACTLPYFVLAEEESRLIRAVARSTDENSPDAAAKLNDL